MEEETNELNIYSTLARQFRLRDFDITYYTIGLNEEAGEVAGKIKKAIRDKGGAENANSHEVLSELGDCLWYITMLADCLGFTLSDVMNDNLTKLQRRKENGTLQGEGDER